MFIKNNLCRKYKIKFTMSKEVKCDVPTVMLNSFLIQYIAK